MFFNSVIGCLDKKSILLTNYNFLNHLSKGCHTSIVRTPYHVVDPSPWPLLMGGSIWGVAVMFICWANSVYLEDLHWGVALIVATGFGWIRDIITESTFQGFHTEKVQSGLTLGFILFLVSELMLFFSFFWAFFHMALSSSIEIGCCWPPVGVRCLEWSGTPLHNTALLVASSCSITTAHHYFMDSDWDHKIVIAYGGTLYLSYLFIKNQYMEYVWLSFTIADGVYGSCFFMLTGLHGLHVIGGTCGLVFCAIRMLLLQFSDGHHVALTLAIWYWHFVDVVWLGLFFIIYVWGS
uniref:Cytochrome c oxidase subunit 3 n=1 Tax=Crassostrea tulipa TaxID=2912563 RepID=A0A0K0PXN7_9BIVA|nr:cytochrome c oxidase subunit III [Crassostrea gasar]AKQ78436.1 cytochrome c oxidase subunit III [Crassostrea gasar]